MKECTITKNHTPREPYPFGCQPTIWVHLPYGEYLLRYGDGLLEALGPVLPRLQGGNFSPRFDFFSLPAVHGKVFVPCKRGAQSLEHGLPSAHGDRIVLNVCARSLPIDVVTC